MMEKHGDKRVHLKNGPNTFYDIKWTKDILVLEKQTLVRIQWQLNKSCPHNLCGRLRLFIVVVPPSFGLSLLWRSQSLNDTEAWERRDSSGCALSFVAIKAHLRV